MPKDKKEQLLQVMCTPEQKERWQRAAEASEEIETFSQWVRLTLDRAAKKALRRRKEER